MTDDLAFQLDLDAPIPPRWRGSHRWGGWRLYEDHLAYGDYVFGLDDCTNSARVLDMICQIAGKTWATDECLAGLVRALDDIFDPKALLCSCGGDKRITKGAHPRQASPCRGDAGRRRNPMTGANGTMRRIGPKRAKTVLISMLKPPKPSKHALKPCRNHAISGQSETTETMPKPA